MTVDPSWLIIYTVFMARFTLELVASAPNDLRFFQKFEQQIIMIMLELSTITPVLQSLFNQATEKNLLLRTPDGRIFLLAALDDFEEEIERTRQNKELMALLDERSQETERYTLEDVRAELSFA